MACIRQAWLVLGGQTLLLEDPTNGYFCQSLDLGAPTVRENTTPKPNRSGLHDWTQFFGGRVITASITAVESASPTQGLDGAASLFSPYMDPSQRPELHYVLDRPGAAERFFTLHGTAYDWPIAGAAQRNINLQWTAADPYAKDPNTQTATSWAGTGAAGRTYPLTFNRAYPAGSVPSIWARPVSHGDVGVAPLLRFYGPMAAPALTFYVALGSTSVATYYVNFLSSYTIGAGQWVDVDCSARTVYANSDPTQNVAAQIDWSRGAPWVLLMPAPYVNQFGVSAGATTGVSQVQCIWNDRYLT
jgi:hypothetical protein